MKPTRRQCSHLKTGTANLGLRISASLVRVDWVSQYFDLQKRQRLGCGTLEVHDLPQRLQVHDW